MKKLTHYVSLLQEWKQRMKKDTPVFFVKITKLGKLSMTLGGILVGANTTTPAHLPELVVIMGAHLMTGGLIMIAVAKAVTEKEEDTKS